MKVLVTGATGFIGRHVVSRLLACGHEVTALARDVSKAERFEWFGKVRFISCDVHSPPEELELQLDEHLGKFPAVIHLAWPGLPNYNDLFHFETNLDADYRFIKRLITNGIGQLLITGTCFEYGMQSGSLSEDLTPQPSNPYGFAKNTLRERLQYLKKKQDFKLKWVRLFYTYGEGQNKKSLLSQLDDCIERGDKVFPMSGGEQLRDYLPVEEIAIRLVDLLAHPSYEGVVNLCKGEPISIRRLVEEHLQDRGITMKLKLGHYPYPSHEPMAFWGDPGRYQEMMKMNQGETA